MLAGVGGEVSKGGKYHALAERRRIGKASKAGVIKSDIFSE